jgi:hypothetical protein
VAEKPTNQQSRYLSYLLRLWQESGGDPPLWRASLESPQSDELRGFAGLDGLFAYLLERTGAALPADSFENDERTPETKCESEED